MPEALAELQRQLRLLAEQFRQRLVRELPELSAQAAALRQADNLPARLAVLQSLRQQLHKLAGAAGTFGLHELGVAARQLEQQCNAWVGRGEAPLDELAGFIEALPQLERLAAQTAEDAPPALPLTGEPRAASIGKRIGILEDDPAAGRSMELTLCNFGYQARWFSTIAELEQALAEQPLDVLVVDVNLQGEACDGLQFAEALQKRQSVPLLVVSTQTDFATQLRAVRAGAQGFLAKPINLPALENVLQRLFNLQQGEPYRVLIVDDDHELAAHYALVLRQSHMLVELCHQPEQVLAHMARFNPEVILLDVHMPQCEGPELAQIIRFNDDWLRVPIIYLSAEIDLGQQMRALLRAGDDFVTKPIGDSALITTVFSRAQRARLLSAALSRDSLTGLLKHADIKEQVGHEVARAIRNRTPASVVMLDIDHFKQVNDRYGHPVGDTVIRALANLLRQRLRKIDSLGRYGGEEFLAVLPDCGAEQAVRVIDEIREHFQNLVFQAGSEEFHCSLSAGVAQSSPNLDPGSLLEQADQALYRAKHEGRNRVLAAPTD